MNQQLIEVIKRSKLAEHQENGVLGLNDPCQSWSDTFREFTDTNGELLVIVKEAKKLKKELEEAMYIKLSEFWDTKQDDLELLEINEIIQPIPF